MQTDSLFISGVQGASDCKQIEKYGIKRIVNLSGVDNTCLSAITDQNYLRIDMDDTEVKQLSRII